ncbi:hypothetical protein DEU56DRAFT_794120 [Suillus clintonianus]|uniref:uncharacterized protein n=1 Tax=Suillus clintonianus TaxID=1904413 RepID=UPI001B8777C9|nr:uncharacterized protein DEU56DRAFT_794120 [Suillus clintonianus]KAG2142412.1 hypothetical protein DEU56DRAFT_794120 [Suillus clintonianus]
MIRGRHPAGRHFLGLGALMLSVGTDTKFLSVIGSPQAPWTASSRGIAWDPIIVTLAKAQWPRESLSSVAQEAVTQAMTKEETQ